MKPINFKGANTLFAKNQSKYKPLPALTIEGKEGYVISCWRLSFKERLKVLFFGRVWLRLMSFNKPLTPSFMSTSKTDCIL